MAWWVVGKVWSASYNTWKHHEANWAQPIRVGDTYLWLGGGRRGQLGVVGERHVGGHGWGHRDGERGPVTVVGMARVAKVTALFGALIAMLFVLLVLLLLLVFIGDLLEGWGVPLRTGTRHGEMR